MKCQIVHSNTLYWDFVIIQNFEMQCDCDVALCSFLGLKSEK